MITDMKDSISEIKSTVNERFDKVENRLTVLFNHQSSKLPPWVVVLGTFAGLLIGGLLSGLISALI